MTAGLTLLSVRITGEFIYGHVHGNEFCDDENENETHEWVTEADAKDSNRSHLSHLQGVTR